MGTQTDYFDQFLMKVKRIYWEKAKGDVFSGELEEDLETIKSFEEVQAKIPICLHIEDRMIAYDSDVYEALIYGFAEEGVYIAPQLDNFLHALDKEFPDMVFEPYNASLIQWTEKQNLSQYELPQTAICAKCGRVYLPDFDECDCFLSPEEREEKDFGISWLFNCSADNNPS